MQDGGFCDRTVEAGIASHSIRQRVLDGSEAVGVGVATLGTGEMSVRLSRFLAHPAPAGMTSRWECRQSPLSRSLTVKERAPRL